MKQYNNDVYQELQTNTWHVQKSIIDYSPEDKEWFKQNLPKKDFNYLFGINE